MQYLNLSALGPRMRKPLHELARDFSRELSSHIEVHADGMRMSIWAPYGGGVAAPEVRRAQSQAWDEGIASATAEHGPLGPKNREAWLKTMQEAMVKVRALSPVIDRRQPKD